jgi:hypothetical protein
LTGLRELDLHFKLLKKSEFGALLKKTGWQNVHETLARARLKKNAQNCFGDFGNVARARFHIKVAEKLGGSENFWGMRLENSLIH